MRQPSSEPGFGPFHRVLLADLAELLAHDLPEGRPSLILVDGRSGAGKSTFAANLARARGGALVATDDIAWHLHPTDWATEMSEGVVQPWLAGRPVRYRPPGWVRRHRQGQMEVPAGVDLVIEGVGAARHELAPLAQTVFWVRSAPTEAKRRAIERDIRLGRTRVEAEEFWDEWMAAEWPFLEAEQPWRAAHLVVDGTADPGVGEPQWVYLADGPRMTRSAQDLP